MNIVKSGFIHGLVVNFFGNCVERSGVIKLNNTALEILQRVHADHSFGSYKAKRFSEALIKEDEKAFWFFELLLLFYLITRSNHKMSGEFAFVRYFKITTLIDIVCRVWNCLC